MRLAEMKRWLPALALIAMAGAVKSYADENNAAGGETKQESTQVAEAPQHVATYLIRNDYAATDAEIGVLTVPRLSLVLDYIRTQHVESDAKRISWPYSGLYYREPSEERIALREGVLRSLRALECSSASTLANSIEQQPLLQRIDIPLDYHALRIGATTNPKLPGNYFVHIALENNDFRLWTELGAVQQSFAPRQKLAALSAQVTDVSCASSAWVVVYSGQLVEAMAAASWSGGGVNAPAGSLIVPYFSAMSSEQRSNLAQELFHTGSFIQ